MTTITILKICVISSLLLNVDPINFGITENGNNYGPYRLWWSRYETCRGPKPTNLTIFATNLIKDGDVYYSWVNYTFLTETRIDEIKITVYTLKNNRSNIIMRYKLNDPCQHFAVASVIQKQLNAKNCIVQKGNYSCFANLTDISYTFFGKSFFYGEYMQKITTLSKKGNIGCIILNSIFEKKSTP